jgi:drug/metabolite transporter (DMT)-like permease
MVKIKIFAIFLYISAIALHILQTVFIKKVALGKKFTVYDLIFIRTIFSLFILTLFIKPSNLKNKFFIKDFTSYLPLNLQIATFSAIASFGWHLGSNLVPVNNAATISFLTPIITAALSSFFLKEYVPSKTYIITIICFFIILIAYRPNPKIDNLYGYIILFIDITAYAIATILRKKALNKRQSVFSLAYFNLCVMGLVSFLLSLTHKSFELTEIKSNIGQLFLISILYLSEFYLMIKSYSICKVSYLQPAKFTRIVFSVILSYFILQETPSYMQIFAASVVIAINLIFYRK